MNKFKAYKAKKYRIWRRVLFFTVIAVMIAVFTVILGNVLKTRLENTDISTDDIPPVTTPDPSPANDAEESVSHDEALRGVIAACLDLSDASDGGEARAVIDGLRAEGYNAVSFVVRDGDGMITYASPALQSYSGLRASEALVPVDVLKAAVAYAKDRGMRCSAVFSGSDADRDSLISAELAEMGFNDILIRSFENISALDNNAVGEMVSYLETVRGSLNVVCGVSLSPDVLTVAQNAPYIEKLYKKFEYLAIDMTGIGSDGAADICGKLQGSFSMYMLRPVLDGDNADKLAEIRDVLTATGVGARQYISWVKKPVDPDE